MRVSKSNITGVSVIVCCYNSAKRLPETLWHLALQNVPENIKWEVIVVDNNSTDNTSEVGLQIWNGFKKDISFRIVKEEQQGLSYARHTGAKEAQFEFLVFCDDDNWFDENYIHYAFCIMCENNNIGILGGRSKGVFESKKPEWFDRFETAYAVGKPYENSGVANVKKYLAGAGMVMRKSTLQKLETLSFKQLLTDRRGIQLSSGGDAELSLVLLFMGYDLYYDERLQFKHFMPSNRLTWKYCVDAITKGHAIFGIYFELYNYCFKKVTNGEEVSFDHSYEMMRKKFFRRILSLMVNAKPFGWSIKTIIKSQPGSRREIELKSAIRKFIYLIKNKKRLEQEFVLISRFMHNLQNAKTVEQPI